MSDIANIMYTLGQIARCIWPNGNMPAGIEAKILRTPATGLALMLATPAAKTKLLAGLPDLPTLLKRIPEDFANPDGGVSVVNQGPFWTGWHHYAAALHKSYNLGPDHLERAGKLLFGERWQAELARAIHVGDRRVREWMAGDRKIPAGVWADITVLLRDRQQLGLAMIAELNAAATD